MEENNELLKLQYYLDHVSMFMKDSFGMNERIKNYVNVLNNVNYYSEEFYKKLDIFNYPIPSSEKDEDKFLDYLGSIFGVERNLKITYVDNSGIFGEIGHIYTETLHLTDYDLWIYTMMTIIKNNFDGNTISLKNIYDPSNDSELSNGMKAIKQLGIRYTWNIPDSANTPLFVYIFLKGRDDRPFDTISDNLKKLFYAGKLTIESLGITSNKYFSYVQIYRGVYVGDDTTIEDAGRFFKPGEPGESDFKLAVFS